MPELFIIAGCNGAGKTTAAYHLLPDVFQTIEFVNADEIARAINTENVDAAAIAAARVMIQRVDELIESEKSFSFETTLSGLSYLKVIEKARVKGFTVTLFFVYLSNAIMAFERVAIRVKKGGHHIPKQVIERRYEKGIKNFFKYIKVVDNWYLLNNSTAKYEFIAKCINNEIEIINFELYNNFIENDSNKKNK